MVDHMIQHPNQYDILIVDDTPDSLEVLSRTLKERGYRVRPTTSGRHALKSVAARLPDLILLDVKMPDVDGYQICRRLKGNVHSCDVPVIFISALGETAKKVEGFKAGGVDYITKPFEATEVLARVGTHLCMQKLTNHLNEEVRERTEALARTNQQLLASEKRFRDIVENSPDRIARYDLELRRTYVNPAIQNLFGDQAQDVLGKTPADQSPISDPQAYMDHLRQAIETATECSAEIPYRTTQGEMRWCHIRFVPEFGPDGQVVSVFSIGRDIHEVKENERRFRRLAENFPDFVVRFDRDGRHTYVNPAVEKAFGMPAEAIIGKTLHELPLKSEPELNDILGALARRVFTEGEANQSEARWDTEFGERIYEVRHIPEKDAGGNVVSVLGIGRDITERKLLEQERMTYLRNLRESEERYRLVFENSPVSIWEEDFSAVRVLLDDLKKQGVRDIEVWLDHHPETVRQWAESIKIVDVNQAAIDLFGAASKAELRTGLVQIFTPETLETFRRELICLWHGETEMVADSVAKTLAGERRDLSVYFSVCAGHEKTLTKVIVSLIDITERKRNEAVNRSRLHLIQFADTHSLDELLEETLNEAEKLTGSRIGFYHLVQDDQKTLTLQNWSTRTKAQFCRVEGKALHYPISEAGVWVDCVHRGKPVIHNDYAALPHRKGMPDGHAEVIRQLVVPVMRGKKITAILGVGNKSTDYTQKDVEIVSLLADLAWEIAERKRTEEEIQRLNQELEQRVLKRTAELEAANKEMHDFTYTVSHDLRAPLRHIDGFVELLQKKAGMAMDEQGRHYMEAISGAARKMGLLVDDLLSFSRMGRHAMMVQRVNLSLLVREVIRELQPDAAGRDIHWCIGDLPQVTGDARMLRSVLTNLIANALKFTRPRKKARIEIGSQPGRHDETVIFVRDNGVGFDMAHADKLFGVFQRLHRDEEFEGTGIGLVNIRRIIALHGGCTWAEGENGKGATFSFSLPDDQQRDDNE
jgi:PAS domain S-box-containing protein